VDQQSVSNRPAIVTDKAVVWIAETPLHDAFYLAAFNRSESPMDLSYSWKELGLKDAAYFERDLWERKDLPPARSLAVRLPAHGSVLYRLQAGSPPARH
jgi:hypothetical protein